MCGKQTDLLKCIADPSSQFVGRHSRGVGAIESDRPGRGLHEPIDHLERGRLAAPGATEHDEQLSGLDREREVTHDDVASVLLREMLELDHGTTSHTRQRDVSSATTAARV